MDDQFGASRFNHVGPRDLPHLLEWHSSHCICLADASAFPRVKNLLRQLAADLAIEADALRRQWQARDLAAITPHAPRPQFLPGERDGRPGVAARFWPVLHRA
ncbi:hypothetical protein [Rhodoplanes sp. Z2-YC6860]|uniref:hypothetical protein n=1 Tax=Rhodoplanes sp. Z2-YC6860 TaxID=674703 RepID=UPI00082F8E46|nr:hypothetical protein [Rhodoplanes sp. Z2-YC6860]